MQKEIFLRSKERFEKKASLLRRVPRGLSLALSLGLLAAVFWGCEAGRVLLQSCTFGDNATCPEGQVCKAVLMTPETGQGVCAPGGLGGTEANQEKLFGESCTPGQDEECEGDLRCWDMGGGEGKCLPADTCTLPHGEECAEGYRCADAEWMPDGLGICVPETCDNNNPCPSGWRCRANQCVPATCTQDSHCPPGWTCDEIRNTCLPPRCENNSYCPPGWSCRENTCIPPSCTPGRHDECPNGFKCFPSASGGGQCLPENSCLLSNNNEDCAPGLECRDSPYAPPEIGMCMPEPCDDNTPCPHGWTCQRDTCVPNFCFLDSHCPPGWTCNVDTGTCLPPPPCEKNSHCPPDWTCEVVTGTCIPPSPCPPNNNPCPPGWICRNGQCVPEEGMVFERDTDVHGAGLPLAWTNNRLVIGSTHQGTGRIHFFNPSTDELSLNPAPLEPLTGLAALGNSGRVAFSTRTRVSVVNSNGLFSTSNRATDCVAGQPPQLAHADFRYGLALLEIGNDNGTVPWRFAVPVNDSRGHNENENRMLAYRPWREGDGAGISYCIPGEGVIGGPEAPLVWMSPFAPEAQNISQILMLRRRRDETLSASEQGWNTSNSTWLTAWSQHQIPRNFERVLDVAADSKHVWITAAEGGFSYLLHLPRLGSSIRILNPVQRTSPPALDAHSNAYVVVLTHPNQAYEIRRYLPSLPQGDLPDAKGTLFQPPAPPAPAPAPVGSPILGQPVGNLPAEVYVVTTDGFVYAFRADTLLPLWVRPLHRPGSRPINVHPSAQPVLKGNRLWVIGTEGELRSMVVNSDGLNRSAQWPRMHRDNCNSNSHLSSSLPHCF